MGSRTATIGQAHRAVIPENMDVDNPITPGEILLEEYLKPIGISQNAMARAIGVSPRAINEIVHAKRSITPAMSIRFGAFFGQSDEFWHGLQVECDFRKTGSRREDAYGGDTGEQGSKDRSVGLCAVRPDGGREYDGGGNRMSEPLKVFITYSHKDTDDREELRRRLAVMEQQGIITLWDDNEILPGDEWYKDISNNLTDSDILLYLVSAWSLASKNCNKELGDALGSEIRVIPIILESCDWQNHQLSDIQALPDKGKPINEWTHKSKAWQNVVDGVRKAVDKMQSQTSGNAQKETLSEWVFQQGNFLMTIGQIDRAIEAYLRAIELDPGSAKVYNNRGNAYEIKNDVDHAITDYTKAIKLNPELAVAYSNRGVAYDIKGYTDQAIADLNKAIELKSDDAAAYYNRGIVYRSKGDVDRSIEDYTKAIELSLDYAMAYYNRGEAYYMKKDLDRAIEDYSQAIKLEPNYVKSYINRGVAYRRKGKINLAIKDYTKAIELNPGNDKVYKNRGMAYYMKGAYDRAIEDYSQVIELNPDDKAYFTLGMCWIHLQNWQEAQSNLIIAKRMGMDIIEAFCGYYKNVETFKKRHGVQLPGNISAMLTQR